MKKSICVLSAVLLGLTLIGCGPGVISPKIKSLVPTEKIEGSSLFVKKVENMPEDFILGMDISSVLAEENSGVKYYDFDGNERDLFEVLASSGVNTVRIRVWNDPFDSEGRGFGGGNNDLEAAVKIGRRAAAVGMGSIIDFHLSDFWADPGKQQAPRAWKGMNVSEKAEAVYEYVKTSLERLVGEGVNVRIVQIGNETNGGLAGETSMLNMAKLMQAGSRAVREAAPGALVALHFANPEKAGSYAETARKLSAFDVDYDVFASSYYPYWHGTLENLASVLNDIAVTYNKKVMVMETSYAYTAEDSDFWGNTIGDGGGFDKPYPFTVQGQANEFRDVADAVVNGMRNGIGVVYWEGAWITVGGSSLEENRVKWETFGSGWASSYASSYDPDDAGRYFGGSAVDNQAFFDPEGKPLESLRVFNLVRWGNEVPVKPDAVEDTQLVFDLNGDIVLPETVNAVMNDGSKEPIPVEWRVTEADIAVMKSSGAASYEFTGAAEGYAPKLYIKMIEYNFMENYSFESGELEPWRLIDRGSENELKVENKPTDSLTGDWHMHFWSDTSHTVDFSIEQDLTGLKPGTYKFSLSVMGGDCVDQDIYIYALVDGLEVGRAALGITYYAEWDTAWIHGITVGEGQTLTVGICVKCGGQGSGAWGKIDDALLNSEG